MSRLSAFGRLSTSSCRRVGYRPRVEPLEPRLPPGTVLGLILPVVDLEGPILPDVPTVHDRSELGIADGHSTDLLAWARPVQHSTATSSARLHGETDDAPQGRRTKDGQIAHCQQKSKNKNALATICKVD